MPNGEQDKSYVAEAINPLEADAELMAKMFFAEDAMGGPEAWMGIGNVAINRLRDGRYGKNLKDVINKMSAAITTKSPQWQKVDKGELNPFENMAFKRMKEAALQVLSEQNEDNTGGATLFENIDRFGFPKTWDKSKVEAVKKIGRHTYFKENRFPKQAPTPTPESSFGEEFKKARGAGSDEFTWMGNKYNTRLKGE